ncbi:hypothetical protein JWG39_11640 [Desulforhopalus vacuolatus]|uniref:hypothetical protein n=1 Tax=Desulforhopalus vacuolatus TaxID=40414 RepID=UPI0019653237|nr:hypothetical protein [Desulforhopalus vacuolatus]MBM9520466.1 hypothetical protein [Desulforhopalus vacuolatus]
MGPAPDLVVPTFAISNGGIVGKIGDRFFLYWMQYVLLGIGIAQGYLKKLDLKFLLLSICLFVAYSFEVIDTSRSPYLDVKVIIGSIFIFWTIASNENIIVNFLMSKKKHLLFF